MYILHINVYILQKWVWKANQTNEKPQCASNTIPYYITHLKNFSKRYFYRNLNTEKFTKSQFIFIYIFELIIKDNVKYQKPFAIAYISLITI